MARRRLLKKEGSFIGGFFVSKMATGITATTLTGVTCPSAVTGGNMLSAETVFYDTQLTDAQVANLVLSASPYDPPMFDLNSSFINTNHSITKTDRRGNTTYKFITIYCNSNDEGDERSGKIYIKQGDDIMATITVKQAGYQYRERFFSHIGDYHWSLGEEREAKGYWIWEKSVNGSYWEDYRTEDISDDVVWTGMTESGLFRQTSFHQYEAIATGQTGADAVRASYNGTFGRDIEFHHYEVGTD